MRGHLRICRGGAWGCIWDVGSEVSVSNASVVAFSCVIGRAWASSFNFRRFLFGLFDGGTWWDHGSGLVRCCDAVWVCLVGFGLEVLFLWVVGGGCAYGMVCGVDFPVEMGVGRTLFVVMVILVKIFRQDGFSGDEFVMGNLCDRFTVGGEGVKLMGLWLEAMTISGWQGRGDDVARGGFIKVSIVDRFSDVAIESCGSMELLSPRMFGEDESEINCCSRRAAMSSLHSLRRRRNSMRHSSKILLDIVDLNS
ncbi:hypothetical protein FH972_017663 [Carpinus fangiana]|uniref:Uncharacterized protein n=1 Tax=Carpinus fangiana TaxID=176857 RepID=A0A5N6RN15_9ROSI|nr:hypothetical protein FH972_017663 [Carpinus fangiana]